MMEWIKFKDKWPKNKEHVIVYGHLNRDYKHVGFAEFNIVPLENDDHAPQRLVQGKFFSLAKHYCGEVEIKKVLYWAPMPDYDDDEEAELEDSEHYNGGPGCRCCE